MSNELQQLQSAAVNGEALHLGVRATETLWLEVSAMIKQIGRYKDAMAQIKREAVKLYPNNEVFRTAVKGIE